MSWLYTGYSFSGQEGVHEERIDPLLSGWVHVREVLAELLDAGNEKNVAVWTHVPRSVQWIDAVLAVHGMNNKYIDFEGYCIGYYNHIPMLWPK